MHTIGKILSAPFDRRAWGNRIVTLLIGYALIFGLLGALSLVDLISRTFA